MMTNRRRYFSLTSYNAKYDPALDTDEDVEHAVRELFEECAGDLGVEDMRDPAFIDYARDAMCGVGVPEDLRDRLTPRKKPRGRKGLAMSKRRNSSVRFLGVDYELSTGGKLLLASLGTWLLGEAAKAIVEDESDVQQKTSRKRSVKSRRTVVR